MVFSLWTPDVEQEANELIALLHFWGITYLIGDERVSLPEGYLAVPSAAFSLLLRLAGCKDARVRDACISLLLLHPELAGIAREAIERADTIVSERLVVLVMATLYLQRCWSVRLALAFGHASHFPELPFREIWQASGLPTPECHFGLPGLLALQQAEQERVGLPVAVIGDWQNQVQHLLAQEEARQRPVEERVFPIYEGNAEQRGACQHMSMRPDVDKTEIERFLRALGQRNRKAGRLYLAGGAALVHAGIRSGRTPGIGVEVSDGDMLLTIDQLKQHRHVNIEIASPKDFMPVPVQWETMSRYVGRYGNIEVFYFDFYSIALSKIERGTTRDLQDVQLLVQQQVIDLQTLDGAFQDVLSQVQTPGGRMRYSRFNPTTFAARYNLIRQQLAQL